MWRFIVSVLSFSLFTTNGCVIYPAGDGMAFYSICASTRLVDESEKQDFLRSYFNEEITPTLTKVSTTIVEGNIILWRYPFHFQGLYGCYHMTETTISEDALSLRGSRDTMTGILNFFPEIGIHEYLHVGYYRILDERRRVQWASEWKKWKEVAQERCPPLQRAKEAKIFDDPVEMWAAIGSGIALRAEPMQELLATLPSSFIECYRGILRDEFLDVGINSDNPSGQD